MAIEQSRFLQVINHDIQLQGKVQPQAGFEAHWQSTQLADKEGRKAKHAKTLCSAIAWRPPCLVLCAPLYLFKSSAGCQSFYSLQTVGYCLHTPVDLLVTSAWTLPDCMDTLYCMDTGRLNRRKNACAMC